MDAPKCKLCGERHWGQCSVSQSEPTPAKAALKFETYHIAWLGAHPWYTAAWLKSKLVEGFDVHHIDGNHGNDDPNNLVLIEHSDHMMMHGGRFMGRLKTGQDTWGGEMINLVPTKKAGKFDRKAYQREYMRKHRAKSKP